MGFFITRNAVPCTVADPVGVTLMSDLHIGAANVDYDAIRADLAEAERHGDRININGDVFDAILPKDHKRFKPDCLHPRLQGRADVLDAALEMAVEILKPHAGQIDMIGMGNHETAAEKFHATDLIARLIRRLNGKGGGIKYGGYTGFLEYTLRTKKSAHVARVVIYYHHGGGGSAPVSKGMIDFNRKNVWADADVTWLGHKHNRLADLSNMRMRCPKEGDEPVMEQIVNVMTGAYMDTYQGQTHDDVMARGRRSSYASDWGMAAQGKGGSRLLVKMHRRDGIERIRVVT